MAPRGRSVRGGGGGSGCDVRGMRRVTGGAHQKSHPTPPCRARGGPRPHRQFTPRPTNLHRDHAHLHQGAHTTTSLVHRTPTHTGVALRMRWSTARQHIQCRAPGSPPSSHSSPTSCTHTLHSLRRAVWNTHTVGCPALAARRLPRPQRHACGVRFSGLATPPRHAHTHSLAADPWPTLRRTWPPPTPPGWAVFTSSAPSGPFDDDEEEE